MLLLALLVACGPKDDADPVPPGTSPGAAEPGGYGPLTFDGPVPTNLLMISIDTLRRDRLGRYGGPGVTPFLDGLLEASVVFDEHTTCSNWTYHSTLCTLRGVPPQDWGFAAAFDESGKIAEAVPDGMPFLATWLGEAGFSSLLVTTNALLSNQHNNAEGYDTVALAPDLGSTPASVAGDEALRRLPELAAGGERWFLHLHLMEPHIEYAPPDSYLGALDDLPPIPYDLTNRDGHNEAVYDAQTVLTDEERALLQQHMEIRYDGEIAWLDDQLVDIWADLEAGGWLDDTLVVLWTDHGEQFFERGYQAHAWTLYREETDGVLAFRAPNLPAASWTGPTTSIDLVPTLLTLYDRPIPAEVTGLPLGTAPDDRPRFAETTAKAGTFQSVRVGSEKLHFSWTDPATAADWASSGHGIHFYDLSTDPDEVVDLYDPADPRVLALWELLLPRVEALSVLLPDEPITWPEGLPRSR